MKSKNRRGHVVDRFGSLPTRKTRWYATEKEAHDAAEKLCKRTYRERGRGHIVVE